ncbi:MAG TPA: MerR family transcriptional regulator [Actinomycetaceae bacterium]|nr:MerR family transcriptional regulator [Actinomycetaceae bacterium]
MTIGAVISILQVEFPAVSVSKLRFLEDQGLVTPSRTGSGYRKYSQADVERLRYTLTQQRDHYLPLKVIRENLEDLDAGRIVEPVRSARVVAMDGRLVVPASGARVTAVELSELSGASLADVDEMVQAGLLQPDSRGRYSARAVSVMQLAARLAARGIAPRNLRSMRANADSTASLIDQVVAPARAQNSAIARERSAADATELAEVSAQLYAELLRMSVGENG